MRLYFQESFYFGIIYERVARTSGRLNTVPIVYLLQADNNRRVLHVSDIAIANSSPIQVIIICLLIVCIFFRFADLQIKNSC